MAILTKHTMKNDFGNQLADMFEIIGKPVVDFIYWIKSKFN